MRFEWFKELLSLSRGKVNDFCWSNLALTQCDFKQVLILDNTGVMFRQLSFVFFKLIFQAMVVSKVQ